MAIDEWGGHNFEEFATENNVMTDCLEQPAVLLEHFLVERIVRQISDRTQHYVGGEAAGGAVHVHGLVWQKAKSSPSHLASQCAVDYFQGCETVVFRSGSCYQLIRAVHVWAVETKLSTCVPLIENNVEERRQCPVWRRIKPDLHWSHIGLT